MNNDTTTGQGAPARRPMSSEDLRSALVELVDGTTGVKGTELVALLASHCIDLGFRIPTDGFSEALADLVSTGRLVEVEYEVPEIPGRVKSLYLPAGSRILSKAA